VYASTAASAGGEVGGMLATEHLRLEDVPEGLELADRFRETSTERCGDCVHR